MFGACRLALKLKHTECPLYSHCGIDRRRIEGSRIVLFSYVEAVCWSHDLFVNRQTAAFKHSKPQQAGISSQHAFLAREEGMQV